jgi:YVTN family beta-propeller protein
MPNGLGVAPDGKTLYVAVAGENAVAVVDLDRRRVEGFIPTAWYPTAVSVTPDGERLAIVNTNASGAGPNPCNSLSPRTDCPDRSRDRQYPPAMIKGSVQLLDVPSDGRLARYTAEVRRNNQARARGRQKPPELGAIRHVIYVIKENRTYDQVFGDLGKGNGDPSLTLFKDDSAPNHRELARRFVLFDNFYVDAEVSADGHPWSTQAVATDYVQMTWPIDYSYYPRYLMRNYDEEYVTPAEQFASEPLAADPTVPRSAAAATAGYLWDDAYDHGVSFRDYGEGTPWADPTNCGSTTISSDLTRLSPRFGQHVDPRYTGWNMRCSDHNVREPEWQREFQQFVQNGNLPALSIVYLPNDHTRGTFPQRATPASYVADNDLALGRLVEAVSASPYWPETAIFVLEDDAQNGPDHVDAHRTEALVISPYTQTGAVDSTFYSTSSMLRTLELIVGLPPMTQFDAAATPMLNSFTDTPNLQPYTAIIPDQPLDELNVASAPMAAESLGMDFSAEDRAPDEVLNAAIWKSVRGEASEMPAPRTAFREPSRSQPLTPTRDDDD